MWINASLSTPFISVLVQTSIRPVVLMDLQINAVSGVVQRGLQDQESIEVRLLNPFFGVFWIE